ncbi:hypothetical protein BHQ19_30585 [Mycolicibacterium porcinum]|nr:hypothetical protein BHQ19_30585 [Mycolicibacterium porcinum]
MGDTAFFVVCGWYAVVEAVTRVEDFSSNLTATKVYHCGVEIHFPEFQFGRGLKAVTVPWAKLADHVRVEVTAIMG